MVWRPIIILLLLTVLHEVLLMNVGGAIGDGVNVNCRNETAHQCGEDLTITCTLSQLKSTQVNLKYNGVNVFWYELLNNTAEGKIENETCSIEWREKKIYVTIFKFKFSSDLKYTLYLNEELVSITPNISGTCKPEITVNCTNELQCEAESDKNTLIQQWFGDRTKLNTSGVKIGVLAREGTYTLRSTLSMTEAQNYKRICCSVKDGTTGRWESCIKKDPKNLSCWLTDDTLPTSSPIKGGNDISRNSIFSAVLVLLAVVFVAAALLYLLKKRNRMIIRETPKEQTTTEPPLLQNTTEPPLLQDTTEPPLLYNTTEPPLLLQEMA